MNSASSGWAKITSARWNTIRSPAYRTFPRTSTTRAPTPRARPEAPLASGASQVSRGTKGLNANMSEGDDLDLEHRIEELEASFRRDGLPNLAEHYTASEDVFTRALPLLSLVFLIEVLNALNLTWTWWQNTLALLGGLAVLIGVTGALNRLRGRPFLSLPRTVGVPEMGAFVLVPPVLPLLFGGQWR